MFELKSSMEQIRDFAQLAETNVDEAILGSELPGEHPAMVALRGAYDALKRIRVAAQLDSVSPMDLGQL